MILHNKTKDFKYMKSRIFLVDKQFSLKYSHTSYTNATVHFIFGRK